tara:strand:- start:20021 stop:20773 length:753 start_codon:yes stop_codon:yes gene_type:complete
MKLVSVIIPYYKKKKYIQTTLQSVLKQTYKKLEIILVFDEGNLTNLKYIKKLSKIDKRIKLIINNKNEGAGESRNVGIKKSKGEYIAFIDSDDLWNKNKITKQIKFLKNKNTDICHTSYKIINGQNKKIGFREARNFFTVNDLIKSCDIGLSTVMLRKTILNKNLKFPKIQTKEDFVLWLKLLKKKIKIYGLKENLVSWRKSKNALSSSFFRKILDGFRVYNKYMNFNLITSIYYLFLLSLNYMVKRTND